MPMGNQGILQYGKTPIPLLYENDLCFVFNKPAGLAVQGGEGVKTSLDSILSLHCSPRPLLVHRLDRDTSGVILVAKTKEAAHFFSGLFSSPKSGLKKQYLAVCKGVPEPETGKISLAIDGKKSETFYKLISSLNLCVPLREENSNKFSMLELELGTGRMHQIRRHLSQISHPLLGDDKYGDFSLNKKLRKAIGLKHLLLHASRLIIPHSSGFPGGLDINAPLPDYWLKISFVSISRPGSTDTGTISGTFVSSAASGSFVP